jgi:cytochrome c oxidase subunit 4
MSANTSLTDDHEHTSVSGYLKVFAALMVLTIVTVLISRISFGLFWDAAISLAIACTKASLVLYYFMHLRESPKIISVIAVGSIAWLTILFIFTIADVLAINGDGGASLPKAMPW